MINVTGRRTQARIQRALVRMMVSIERKFQPGMSKILRAQYNAVSRSVAKGNLKNYKAIIRGYDVRLQNFLKLDYRTTASVFFGYVEEQFKKGIKVPERKDFEDDFWTEMNRWILAESVLKAKVIDDTTINTIRMILLRGFNKGKTNAEMSKELVERGIRESKWRAESIVRTETHTASMTAIDTAMVKSKQIEKKEWVNAGDNRVRTSPFRHDISQVVGINKFFFNGEKIKYPGWSRASSANIIRCRCVALYFTAGINGGG